MQTEQIKDTPEYIELKNQLVEFEDWIGWDDFFVGNKAVKIDSLVTEIMGQGIGEGSPYQKLIKLLKEDRWQQEVIDTLYPFVVKLAPPMLVFGGSADAGDYGCEISYNNDVLNIKTYSGQSRSSVMPIKEFLKRLGIS